LALLLPCIPRLRRLQTVVELRRFLHRVPMLADLTRTTLDDLALHLRLENAPDNTTIVRQNDVGDTLYLIKSGEAMVLATNDHGIEVEVAVLHAMDYFGEIALLRDVPRTATVRARGPVQLFSLTRADFQKILVRSEEFRETVAKRGDARYLETQCTLLALR
ncbi:MAG TPA: cyclic nucleotide-binding domain-containing protein, partial [Chloroflexota bacterium]